LTNLRAKATCCISSFSGVAVTITAEPELAWRQGSRFRRGSSSVIVKSYLSAYSATESGYYTLDVGDYKPS
jgi:hypothetical protein